MYLDEIDSKRWVLADAIVKYTIKYRNKDTATAKLKQHLLRNFNNPNLKKACKDDTKVLLEQLDPSFAFDRGKKASTATSSTTASSANNSGNSIGTFYNHQGTVNMSTVNHNTTVRSAKKRKTIEDVNPNKEEVDELFNNIQNSDEPEDDAPIYLKLQKNIKIIKPKAPPFVCESINFTAKFLEYQEYCLKMANTHGFILESHAHEVLMLSSILLVRPNQHSPDMLLHFSQEELNTLRTNILNDVLEFDNIDVEFDESSSTKVTRIAKNLVKQKITREEAVIQLINVKSILPPTESILIDSIINLVFKLPETPIVDPLGEMELMCGYVDPVLFPIFTNYKSNTKLIWPNLVQKESKESQYDVNSSRRPDAVIRTLHQHSYAEARGFGEVKTAERVGDTYELVRDLIRCNVFSKESIDINDMKGNLYFQVVGPRINFSLMVLKSEGMYISVDICTLEIPLSLENLPSFITCLDNLLLVLKVFEKACCKNDIPIMTDMKRGTLDSPTFHNYVDKKKSKYHTKTLVFH